MLVLLDSNLLRWAMIPLDPAGTTATYPCTAAGERCDSAPAAWNGPSQNPSASAVDADAGDYTGIRRFSAAN